MLLILLLYDSNKHKRIISYYWVLCKGILKMGMDGLSMANTGRLKEATSLDYSKETEEIAKEDTEKSMIVQELTEQERVNEEKEENKKRRKSEKKQSDDDSDDGSDADNNELNDDSGDNNGDDNSNIAPDDLLLLDGENKGFYTKLSKNLENIELYDRITDRLIGTITPAELSYLITKLNMGTGIFINKKV